MIFSFPFRRKNAQAPGAALRIWGHTGGARFLNSACVISGCIHILGGNAPAEKKPRAAVQPRKRKLQAISDDHCAKRVCGDVCAHRWILAYRAGPHRLTQCKKVGVERNNSDGG